MGEGATSYGIPTNGSEWTCGNSSVFTYYSEFHRSWSGAGLTEALVLIVVCAASLSTNAAVIYCAVKHPSLRTTTNYLVINLAVADLLFALTMPFVAAVRISQTWIFHDFVCKLLPLVQLSCGAVLLWSLTLISVERYRCIVSRPWRRPHFTVRGAVVVVAAVWLVPLSLSAPVASYFEVIRVNVGGDLGLTVCTLCYPQGRRVRLAGVFLVLWLLGLAILPASVMLFNYYRILKKLKVANTFSVSLKMRAHRAWRRGRGAAEEEEEPEEEEEGAVRNDRVTACRKCSQFILDDGESPRTNSKCCEKARGTSGSAPTLSPTTSGEKTAEEVEGRSDDVERQTAVEKTLPEVAKERRCKRSVAFMKHVHNERVIRVLIVDVLAVFVMWAPIWAILIAIYVDSADDGGAKRIRSHDFVYCLTVAYANSWLNAILYGVLNGNFRPYICYA